MNLALKGLSYVDLNEKQQFFLLQLEYFEFLLSVELNEM